MRVLHVIPALASRYGGPSAATVGICRALARAGVETVVASTDADGPSRLPVPIGRVEDFRGIPVIFFPRQFSESLKYSSALARWVSGHVQDFDLVHVHAVFSHSSLAAGQASLTAGVPYIVRPLGTLDPWSLRRHRGRKQLMLMLGLRRVLRQASAVHYTAVAEQSLAERELPWLPRGYVSPLGVDDALFAGAEASYAKRPEVLSVSRIDPKKGIDVLIDAFHRLAGDPVLADWQLVIGGDGAPDYVARLREAARQGAGGDRITFCGWLDDGARRERMQSASVFALPSQQENFGIALVEALACGTPAVVAPGVNLGHELSNAGAGWVVEREPQALADALASVMRDADERARRGANAASFARRFQWDQVTHGLRAMYDTVLHTPRPGPAAVVNSARPA
jgi:glycosyltransferase involved in cell wall biosynthesis